jgi:hypothetical protein
MSNKENDVILETIRERRDAWLEKYNKAEEDVHPDEGDGEYIEICEVCEGTGEYTTMEKVWAGEPHEAPIGTAHCNCEGTPRKQVYLPVEIMEQALLDEAILMNKH